MGNDNPMKTIPIKIDHTNTKTIEQLKKEIEEVISEIEERARITVREIKYFKDEHLYGLCTSDGIISLKLQYHDGERVPELRVWQTVAHELTHRLTMNHSVTFWYNNRRMVTLLNEITGMNIKPILAFVHDDDDETMRVIQ